MIRCPSSRTLAAAVLAALVLATGCVPTEVRSDAACASAIAWEQAPNYVGQWVTVRGQVVDSYWADQQTGQPTFLDLGAGYPEKDRFTVVIWGQNRPNFPETPERYYRGRTICVTGVVDTATGAYGMEVTSPANLVRL